MKHIPPNLLSLYADIQQKHALLDVEPASISRKKVGGRLHLYAAIKDGASRRQLYLGPAESAEALERAEAHERAARQRAQLKKSVQALTGAGLRSPGVQLGRILEAAASSGLFSAGAVLVGTIAYQQFPCLVGAYLSEGSAQTEDADLAATRVALDHLAKGQDLLTTLQRADPTFKPEYSRASQLPRRFVSEAGFIVELLTTKRRKDGPVAVPALGCAAMPIPFIEYAIEGAVDAIALYGAGVRVRVPDPARYAVHKLIVHQLRTDPVKRVKDLVQARELFEVYRQRDPGHLAGAIEDAVARGRTWSKLVRTGLRLIET